MIRIIKFIVHLFNWIQAFAAPFLACSIIAVIVYSNNTKNEILAWIIFGIGVIAGIVFAEYVRRKYGFNVFFSRVFGSAVIDEKIRSKK